MITLSFGGDDDPFMVTDLGDVMDKYTQWKKKFTRIKHLYGTVLISEEYTPKAPQFSLDGKFEKMVFFFRTKNLSIYLCFLKKIVNFRIETKIQALNRLHKKLSGKRSHLVDVSYFKRNNSQHY